MFHWLHFIGFVKQEKEIRDNPEPHQDASVFMKQTEACLHGLPIPHPSSTQMFLAAATCPRSSGVRTLAHRSELYSPYFPGYLIDVPEGFTSFLWASVSSFVSFSCYPIYISQARVSLKILEKWPLRNARDCLPSLSAPHVTLLRWFSLGVSRLGINYPCSYWLVTASTCLCVCVCVCLWMHVPSMSVALSLFLCSFPRLPRE